MGYDYYDILINFAKFIDHKEIKREEVITYFKDNYNFKIDESSDDQLQQHAVLLINNFIFLISEVIDDFVSANMNIELCEVGLRTTEKESYENRKYKHFLELNKNAIREIEEYLRSNLTTHLKEKMAKKAMPFKERNSLQALFDKGKLDFRFLNDYFDPHYDFSTYIRFMSIYLAQSEVAKIIEMKKTDPKKFSNFVNNEISEKDILGSIIKKINNHHRLVHRKEIFDTMKELYEKNHFLSFVNLAVIQVEGLFYDLCLELNGGVAENNIGTLVEKVEKAYKDNKYLCHMISPYFQFEFPVIRNKVAHDGIIKDINLDELADNLILDIYCIVHYITSPTLPINNLYSFLVNIIDHTGLEINQKKNYNKILCEILSHSNIAIKDDYNIFKEIKNRANLKEVLEFYTIGKTDEFEGIKLNIAVDQLALVFENIDFWEIVVDLLTDYNGNEFGFDSLSKLVKEFIGFFHKSHPVKSKCAEAADLINKAREKFNGNSYL